MCKCGNHTMVLLTKRVAKCPRCGRTYKWDDRIGLGDELDKNEWKWRFEL